MPTTKSQIFTRFVGKIEVKPREQSLLPLGEFSVTCPAKGFSIEFGPDLKVVEPIVAQIATSGSNECYRLVLHVVNRGNKRITATVWGM